MLIKVSYREARRLFSHGWEIDMYDAAGELVHTVHHDAGSCRGAARWFHSIAQDFGITSFTVGKRG